MGYVGVSLSRRCPGVKIFGGQLEPAETAGEAMWDVHRAVEEAREAGRDAVTRAGGTIQSRFARAVRVTARPRA